MSGLLDHRQDEAAPPVGIHPLRLVVVAIVVGFTAELLVHDVFFNGAPLGLGFTLAAAAVGLTVAAATSIVGRPPSPSALLLLGLMGFFAAMITVRASPELAAANALAAVALGVGSVYLYRGRRLTELALSEYLTGGVLATFGSLAGPARFAAERRNALPRMSTAAAGWAPVARGAAIAVVPIVVFGLLFASADAVFADWVGRPFSLRLSGGLVRGAVLAFAIAWATAGALYHAVQHEDWPEPAPPRPPLAGSVEFVIVLGALNGLFLLFVGIQFAYLFGGAATVANTGGLTYAEYARRGFFELLAVAALVTLLVLMVDWWSGDAAAARRPVLQRLQLALVGLTGIILASAVVRLAAYVDEFGLSKIRLYAAAVLAWVGVLLVWLVVTVLRGRRRRFPIGAFVAGVAVLAALNLASPDALIARVNVERHLDGTRTLDVAFVTANLSEDAVPTLLDALDRLDACTAADLRVALVAEHDGDTGDWRSLNLARERAADALEALPASAPAASC